MGRSNIVIRDFKLGQVTIGDDGALPVGGARRVVNLFTDKFGTMSRSGGVSALLPSRANPVVGFIRYIDPKDTNYKRLLFMEKTGAVAPFNYPTYLRDEASGVTALLGTPVGYFDPAIIQSGRSVYITQSNGTLLHWPGPPTAAFRTTGLEAPAAAAGVALNGGGVLTSVNGSPYTYYYTQVDDLDQESNPAPASAEIAANANTIRVTIPITATPNIAKYRIYRIGGKSKQIRRVAEVNFAGAIYNYDDNTLEDKISLIQLETTHTPAPGGFKMLALHRNRLWGAGIHATLLGSATRLFFSSFGNFGYWPMQAKGTLLDGGYLTLDDNSDDYFTGLSSIGNLLTVHRRYSTYFLYGDRWDNFNPIRESEVGTIAPRSIARKKNSNFRLGSDGQVWIVAPKQEVMISESIENTLSAIPEALLENACGEIHNDAYILDIPNPGGTPYVFRYDMKTNAWSEGADATDKLFNGVEIRSLMPPSSSARRELLVAVVSGYLDAAGAAYNGIVKMWTPDATSRTIEWTSDCFDFDQPNWNHRLVGIKIEGTITVDSLSPPVVTIITTKKDGTTQITTSYNLATGSGVLLNKENKLSMIGVKSQVRIKGKITAGKIRRVTIYYTPLGPVKI